MRLGLRLKVNFPLLFFNGIFRREWDGTRVRSDNTRQYEDKKRKTGL